MQKTCCAQKNKGIDQLTTCRRQLPTAHEDDAFAGLSIFGGLQNATLRTKNSQSHDASSTQNSDLGWPTLAHKGAGFSVDSSVAVTIVYLPLPGESTLPSKIYESGHEQETRGALGMQREAASEGRGIGVRRAPGVLPIELLGGQRDLRDRKSAVVRVAIPSVLERVKIDAVAFFAEIVVFDVA